jgi:peptidoglycan/LPS O-acetylase OafA/YrhL
MANPSPDNRPHLHALTGLRFFAALWVVCHHYVKLLPQHNAVTTMLALGPYAVDLFFILSGFVLAYVYAGRDHKINLKAYVNARLARIYPLYIIGIGISIPLIWFTQTGVVIRAHALPILLSFFAGVQAWYPLDSWLELNNPLWSLSVELFFYAVFPLIIPLCYTAASRRSFALPACLLLVGCYVFANSRCYEAAAAIFPSSLHSEIPIWGWHPLVNLPLFILGALLGSLFIQ